MLTTLHALPLLLLLLLPLSSGESYSRAYPDLLKLHMLQELEDAWGLQRTSVSTAGWPAGRAT
jgi:hypothetical protein